MARRSLALHDAHTRPNVRSSTRRWTAGWLVAVVLCTVTAPVGAQQAADGPSVTGANYRLAARFAPYKMRRLVYSTSVAPRWMGTERFWYEWESAAGKLFYVVDPAAGTKRQIFDNDRLAAELTRITKDPWDGQHLPIRQIKFLDGNTLQFEVESSQDDTTQDAEAERGREQQGDQQGQRRRPPRAKKKVFHFRTIRPDAAGAGGLPGAGQPRVLGQHLPGRWHRHLHPQEQPVHDDE
jgi:hypothetical protein